ncbi:cupin domain-containing protein [Pseudopelagicola sp. nBUS_19]|mgnify:CR=1 FL=1|uniref:cupin domain-containing protein n=1 Tax=Pseudopelagicola sp. nBUS_19 TaxID=3395316 RepID=UPI003EBD1C0B
MQRLEMNHLLRRFDDQNFERLVMPNLSGEDVWWKVVSCDRETDQEIYLMKMAPGIQSNSLIHHRPKEFFILSHDPTDHYGYICRVSDFVSLPAGSYHSSVSKSGCLLVVTHRGPIEDISEADL